VPKWSAFFGSALLKGFRFTSYDEALAKMTFMKMSLQYTGFMMMGADRTNGKIVKRGGLAGLGDGDCSMELLGQIMELFVLRNHCFKSFSIPHYRY